MKSTTTWRIPPWAWVPVAIAITAEATSNALRAYGLGAHLDAFTISYAGTTVSLSGAVLVLAAIAVSLSQTRAAWVALTPGYARQRIVSGLAAVLLLAVSISAMASHIMEAQRTKAGGENADRTTYAVALAAHKRATAELDAIGTVRSPTEIKAAMNAVRIPGWAWRDTGECLKLATDDDRRACRPFTTLRQELGRSLAKGEAEDKARTASATLAAISPPAEATLEETIVSRGWAWVMGLAVVFVATFGTIIFARVETEPITTANDNAPASVPAPQTAHDRHVATLRAWASASGRDVSTLTDTEASRVLGIARGGGTARAIEELRKAA